MGDGDEFMGHCTDRSFRLTLDADSPAVKVQLIRYAGNGGGETVMVLRSVEPHSRNFRWFHFIGFTALPRLSDRLRNTDALPW